MDEVYFDKVRDALSTHGVKVGGIDVNDLTPRPLLLVALMGDQMRRPSVARRRLAEHVSTVLGEAVDSLTLDLDQHVVQVLLALDEDLRPLNTNRRIEKVKERYGPLITSPDNYQKRLREPVLDHIAGLLVASMDDFDPEVEAVSLEYPKKVLRDVDQLVWHLQELGCYLFAYLHLGAELVRVAAENPERYQAWRERLAVPPPEARLALYEYVCVADILGRMQKRSAGRDFLRQFGLGELAQAPTNDAGVVEWSYIGMLFFGAEGHQQDFLSYLEEDDEAGEGLASWHHELTGSVVERETEPAWVVEGIGSLHFLASDVERILRTLFQFTPEAFAGVRDIHKRVEQLTQRMCAREGVLVPPYEPDAWTEVRFEPEYPYDPTDLWDALTLARQVVDGNEEVPMPNMPELGYELVGSRLPDEDE